MLKKKRGKREGTGAVQGRKGGKIVGTKNRNRGKGPKRRDRVWRKSRRLDVNGGL